MLQKIDHIVILVRDLAQASDDYARAGFTVTPGGEHTGGVTHNALISFADGTYFELIAFREPGVPQMHRWWSRLGTGEGLIDYALLSDNLSTDSVQFRARGLEAPDAVDGGRERPDGVHIAWRSVMSGRVIEKPALPFVIQDVTARALRVPGGAAAQHRLAISLVAGLTLATTSLGLVARDLEALLGQPGQLAQPSTDDARSALRFQLGQQWIELIEPLSASDALGRHLQTFGDGPYEVVLSGGNGAQPGQGRLIDGTLHGARLRLA